MVRMSNERVVFRDKEGLFLVTENKQSKFRVYLRMEPENILLATEERFPLGFGRRFLPQTGLRGIQVFRPQFDLNAIEIVISKPSFPKNAFRPIESYYCRREKPCTRSSLR